MTTTAGEAGQQTGSESSLSSWAGPYVTEMLGRGWAAADQPYQAYTGPLTAGESGLQGQAFSGLGQLAMPVNQMTGGSNQSFTPQTFTADTATQYMDPYAATVVRQQQADADRASRIQALNNNAQLTKAGAFGGSRGAIMESERQRNLGELQNKIFNQGMSTAYDKAMQQFNTEQQAGQQYQNLVNQYGLGALAAQLNAGAQERGIEAEGIAADKAQFEEERDFPYKQTQYMQSLLQGLPIGAQSYSYSQPSPLSQLLSTVGAGANIYDLFFPSNNTQTPPADTTVPDNVNSDPI